MYNKILRFFYRKRIVYTYKYKAGVLVKSFQLGDRKFIRIALDNRQKYAGHIPMVDVDIKDVIGIKYCYSKCEVFLWSLLGVKADNSKRPVKPLAKY